MPYALPTVAQFKAQFSRDFPYAVPAWGAEAGAVTLAAGVITAIAAGAGGRGYTQAPTVTVTDPTGSGADIVATIAAGALTGFTITAGGAGYTDPVVTLAGGAGSATDESRVMDEDITGALEDAAYNINRALFGTEAAFQRAYLFLTAHTLVEKLLAAGEGLRSRGTWLATSKTVGDLSESYAIPKQIMEDPFLSSIASTRYGKRYLEIVSPLIKGNMLATYRQTLP